MTSRFSHTTVSGAFKTATPYKAPKFGAWVEMQNFLHIPNELSTARVARVIQHRGPNTRHNMEACARLTHSGRLDDNEKRILRAYFLGVSQKPQEHSTATMVEYLRRFLTRLIEPSQIRDALPQAVSGEIISQEAMAGDTLRVVWKGRSNGAAGVGDYQTDFPARDYRAFLPEGLSADRFASTARAQVFDAIANEEPYALYRTGNKLRIATGEHRDIGYRRLLDTLPVDSGVYTGREASSAYIVDAFERSISPISKRNWR